MLIDTIDISTIQQNAKLYLCKPNLDKTIISRLSEAYNIRLNLKLGNVNQLDFTLPYEVEDEFNHIIKTNTNISLCKDRYIIKLVFGNYVEYFTIRTPVDNMTEDRDEKSFSSFSLQYELLDKSIKAFQAESYNATEALIGNGVNKTGVLNSTLWTLDYIDSSFDLMYRSIDIPSSTVLDSVFKIAETFGAVVIWNTSTRKVSLYKEENIGLNRGLKISYQKYLSSLNHEIKSDDICTKLKVYGKDNISINSVNTTGTNYIEDFGYFTYPFERDINDNVITSSDYMTDGLCHAILNYQELLATKEAVSKIAETGTTTTNIKITGHGLIVGDYIVNTSRGSVSRIVLTVVDANNFTVSAVTNQSTNDNIDLYKNGTFGKLLYQKQAFESTLTTKENELSVLQTELNVILDNLDIAQATGQSTTQILIDLNAKQAQVDAKQAEIDSTNASIASVDSQITSLRSTISVESNFTADQLLELNQFIIEKEVINEFIDNPQELLDWAKTEFDKIKTPPIVLKINIIDLFKCLEKESIIDREKITLAETIAVYYEKMNINIEAKITEIEIDFESEDGLTLTITNVKEILTDKQKFLKMLNQSISTSTQVDLEKFNWNQASTDTNEINQLLNSIWETAERAINSGVNESVTIDRRGVTIKDPTDPLKFIRLTHGVLGITSDGGNTYKQVMDGTGVYAERLVGQIIAGVNLTITNQSGTFTFDQNGATITGANLTITGGLPKAQIDSVATSAWDSAKTAADNFNTRNDRKNTTPANPTITSDGTAVDHSINTDGSADISFEWGFTGTGDAYDIDGFIIYARSTIDTLPSSTITASNITATQMTVQGVVSGIGINDSINTIRVAYILQGTDADANAAVSAGRYFDITTSQGIADFQVSGYTKTGLSLNQGATYIPAVRVLENTTVEEYTADPLYVFGTYPSQETMYYISNDKRAFILYGCPANKYYIFGVQAYRIVDQDINSSGILKSSIIKPSLAGENPYQPSSSVAFTGNVTGTINGSSASTVANNANNSVQKDTSYNGVVINSADGVKVTHSDGSYTQMTGDGFKRYISGSGKTYHYLITTNSVVVPDNINEGGSGPTYWLEPADVQVTLPAEFTNKTFSIQLSVKESYGWSSAGSNIKLEYYNVNSTNGTFMVNANCNMTTIDGTIYRGMTFNYMVIV